MELNFLVETSVLPKRSTRGLLLECPLTLQYVIVPNFVNHVHAVLSPYLEIIKGASSGSEAAVASEKSIALVRHSKPISFPSSQATEDVEARMGNDSTEKPANNDDGDVSINSGNKNYAHVTFSHLAALTRKVSAEDGSVSPLPISILRSEEDLTYVTNTVGVAFTFPCTNAPQLKETAPSTGGASASATGGGLADVIVKAIDVYGILMSASFHDLALAHLPCEVRTKHFVLMVEHLTGVLSVGPRGGRGVGGAAADGLEKHAELVGRVVEVLSKALWWMAGRLSSAEWAHILRILVGCLRYWTSKKNSSSSTNTNNTSNSTPPPSVALGSSAVQSSLATLFWEAIILSDTRADGIWSVIGEGFIPTAETLAQWGAVTVALTRAMARIAMGGSDVCCPITVRWAGGVQAHVRHVTHFIHLEEDSIAFLWKRLFEVVWLGMQCLSTAAGSGESSLETRVLFAGVLRDVSLILSHSSYLQHCGPFDCYTFDKRHENIGPASSTVPLGPSTAAIGTLLGDMMLSELSKCVCPLADEDENKEEKSTTTNRTHKILSHHEEDERDELVIRILQGLSYATLRRETAAANALTTEEAEAMDSPLSIEKEGAREDAFGVSQAAHNDGILTSSSSSPTTQVSRSAHQHPAHATFVDLYFKAIALMNSMDNEKAQEFSPSVCCELIVATVPAFFVDLPIPFLTLESIGACASALIRGAFDSEGTAQPLLGPSSGQGGGVGATKPTDDDEDEEDEEDVGNVARAAAKKVWGCVSLLNSHMHSKVLGIPSPFILGTSAVAKTLVAGLISQHRVAPVMQRLLCASTALFFSVTPPRYLPSASGASPVETAVSAITDTALALSNLSDLLETMLNILSAPYGTADEETLLTALACVGALPYSQYDSSVAHHVIGVLCQCCLGARSVMEQTDLGIEDTTTVYVCAVRAICSILNSYSHSSSSSSDGHPHHENVGAHQQQQQQSSPSTLLLLGRELCADPSTAASLLRTVEAGMREVLVPSSGMRDAATSLYHCYLWCLSCPIAHGCATSSSNETERDFFATATAVKCFAVGSFRLITFIQHSEGVAIIVRDPSGRRVFRCSQKAFPLLTLAADEREGAVAFAKALESAREGNTRHIVTSAAEASEDKENTLDPLREVWAEPSVAKLLDDLRKADNTQRIVSAMGAARFVKRDAYCSPNAAFAPRALDDSKNTPNAGEKSSLFTSDASQLPPSDMIIRDVANESVEGARQVASTLLRLGTASGGVRSIPFDSHLVSVLKGIDALPSKEIMDVPVICIVDCEEEEEEGVRDDAIGEPCDGTNTDNATKQQQSQAQVQRKEPPMAFWSFLASLGRRESALTATCPYSSKTKRVIYEDGYRCVNFIVMIVTADELSAADRAAASTTNALPASHSSVRVLWDATADGYDWPSTAHPTHDAFKELSPNFRAAYRRNCLDFVLTPLPSVGLMNVRLLLPEPLSPAIEAPLRWGAPLLHGSALPASTLTPLLREAVHMAVTQRLMATGSFKFPSLVRKAALWAVAAPHPALLPHQYIASFD